MKHLDTSEIIDFVSGKATTDNSLKARQHLRVCEECSLRAKAHNYIRNNFDQVWSAWTSRKRRSDMLEERVACVLAQVLEKPPQHDFIDRIESWLKLVRKNAGIAWCAAVDSADKVVRVVREHLEELPPLVADIALRPVGAPVALKTRGAVRTRGKGKELRTRGVTKLIATLTVERLERPGGCSIRVKAPLLEKPWPLVMLMPETRGEPIVRGFEKTPEGLVAEFEGLPNVQYYVVVEGSAAKKSPSPRRRTS